MLDLGARLDGRSVVIVMVVVVALLLCAILMPAMAMAALCGCAVAILVMTERLRYPVLSPGSTFVLGAPRAAVPMTRSTGPPIVVRLRI